MKPKYYLIPLAILILCIFIFGFTLGSGSARKEVVRWSERDLKWEDFRLVDTLKEDYVASIYSVISCPDLITDNSSKVYAYMNPNLSERLRGEHDSYNVLVHEQYHFNITEYCARLLRKEIVERGFEGLSYNSLASLKRKYGKKLDSLQSVYDSITDHNVNTDLQRYWELQIDDWLRETEAYRDEDIQSYHNFTKDRTAYFKNIYFTLNQKLLTSYPVGEYEMKFGGVYQITYPGHSFNEVVVKFYQDGILANGGYFESAITKITTPEEGIVEVHYYNADQTYNTVKTAYIRKIEIDSNRDKTERFLDARGNRVHRDGVYEVKWTYNADENSYLTSYFSSNGREIANKNGNYHERSFLDEKGRTIALENLDRNNRLRNDASHIARYTVTYTKNHMSAQKRMYGQDGNFAFHLSDYNLSYSYDTLGRIVRISSLDEDGNYTYDHNGASIYEYSYDRHDRQTSVKRYNIHYEPLVANDGYFQKVTDYDAEGRVIFEAEYLPGYILRFSDIREGATRYEYEGGSIKKLYNVDGYNTVFENDKGVAVVVQNLDSLKRVVSEMYYDAEGNFAKSDDGIASYLYKYDASGNTTETAALDSLGRPHEFEEDVATIRWEYDSRGNKLKTSYYNKKGDLAFASDSVTFNVYAYNDRNQLTERTNFGREMQPAEIEGTYKTVVIKNSSGLDSLNLEYDTNNELRTGVAVTQYFYTPYGNVSRIEYFDRNNQRTKNQEGVSAVQLTYNPRHLHTGYEYYDEENRLCNNTAGVAIENWVLDGMGQMLTQAFFDSGGKPALGKSGYHKIQYTWNEGGRMTGSTTYGADQLPIPDEFGVATYKYTLTDTGMIRTIERFNSEGILANNTDEIAVSHYEPSLNGLYYLDKELNAAGEIVSDSIPEL